MALLRTLGFLITTLRRIAMLLYHPPIAMELSALSTDEPLTPRMKTTIMLALAKYYHCSRRTVYGQETRMHWTSDISKHLGMFTLSNPMKPLHCWNLRKFCNKPTALYWAHSAQINDRCPTFIFGCAYKAWFRAHDNAPNIEFGHFFANPIRITSSGPGTVAGILEAHKSLCNQADYLLAMVRQGRADEVCLHKWPDPRNYKMLPLYRAIIIVLDQFGPFSSTKPPLPISLDEEVQWQTVLMILTGEETGLSAPINFESIRSQSLPLVRSEVADHSIIRVSLRTAIRYIADVQRREEQAFPYLGPSATDRSISPRTDNISFGLISASEWVDEIMQKAEEKGAKNVPEIQSAMEMMKEDQEGNCHLTLEFNNFSHRWT